MHWLMKYPALVGLQRRLLDHFKLWWEGRTLGLRANIADIIFLAKQR
jgi:hypothetical protein